MEKLLRGTIKGVSQLPGKNGAIEYRASIQGNFFGVGESVSLTANAKIYRWKITSISLRGGPVFDRMPVTQIPLSPLAPKMK